MNVFVLGSVYSPTPEVYDTADSASNRMAQVPDHIKSRVRIVEVPVQSLGPQETTSFRYAITYRTDEGLFSVGPAGLMSPADAPPPRASSHLLYRQVAHTLLLSVRAASYEDGLWRANNIAALFAMNDNPYGPETVDVQGEFWKFDAKKGFYKDETPDE